ncbi:MAG: ABC transporter permease [Bryobacteraceae bacterium]
MRRFLARLRNLFGNGQADREATREIEAHAALMQEDYERRGMTPREAGRAVVRELGAVSQTMELHRDARTFPGLAGTLRDLRFGARSLARNPGFSVLAVTTLGLGIGANTAIFSVVKAVLLDPLAYRDADRLVTVLHDGAAPVSPANFTDWSEQCSAFSESGAAEFWSPNLTGVEQPENIRGLRMTPAMWPMLGVEPQRGRWFTRPEAREVVLSHKLWVRRFSADPAVIGKTVALNGEAFAIIGVMPSAFQFPPFWATGAELWAPLDLAPRLGQRGGNSLRTFARLASGVELARARTEMAAVTARLEKRFPGTNRDVVVRPLKENVVGNVETPLLIILGAVALVLLIACANVAHMLLARTADRQREIAVRAALGGGKARLAAQFLTENLLLAALGAALGLAVAHAGTRLLVAASPPELPRVQTVAVDGPVVLFLMALSLVTVLLFGLGPAVQAVRGRLAGAMSEGGRGGFGPERSHMRAILVASEFALAFALLVGAGLLVRSFVALRSADSGFDPRNVISMVVSVAGSTHMEPGRREVLYRRLIEETARIPGVVSAGATNHLPLVGDLWGYPFLIEGRPRPRPGEFPGGFYRIAMAGYFETMRLPLRRGRSLTARDDRRAPPVAWINERAASAYWPGEDPVGKRISFDTAAGSTPVWLTIAGIVANAKQHDWAMDPAPEVYRAGLQTTDFLESGGPAGNYITLVARTAGDPAAVAPALKRMVWSIDRNLPVSQVITMEQAVADATAQPRFEAMLVACFAAIALALSAVGIYGVMAYAVSRRTREIGVRMALGASRGDVLRLVARQGLAQVLVGAGMGAGAALVGGGVLSKVLYGVKPADPATFVGAGAALLLTAMAAVYFPARRASRIEPMSALRSD